jgi:hypothetical protein
MLSALDSAARFSSRAFPAKTVNAISGSRQAIAMRSEIRKLLSLNMDAIPQSSPRTVATSSSLYVEPSEVAANEIEPSNGPMDQVERHPASQEIIMVSTYG